MTPGPLRVHTLIDSLTWGGAEMLLGDLATGAPAAGIELSVGYLQEIDGSPAARRLRERGVEPTSLQVGRLLAPASLWRVRRHLRAVAPDILHTHLSTADILGGLAARSLGIPSLCTIHLIGRPVSDAPGARTDLKQGLTTLVRRGTSARVVAVSEAARRSYLEIHRERPEHVVTIHNGVAPRPAGRSREQVRSELGLAPDAFVAAIVTVLREGKGHELATAAVGELRERFPELHLLVVGDGPDRGRIAALAAPLGANARLVGHREDVPDLLGAADVLIHPTSMDAFPTILLEAAGAGLPVIATAVGGIPEIVDHDRTGLLLGAPPQASELAAGLQRLLLDPELGQRMGAAARERFAAEFSAERWALRLRGLYDEIIERDSARLLFRT